MRVKNKQKGCRWKYFDVLGIEANSQGMELFICQFVLMVSVNNDRIDDGPQDWWGFGRAQNEEFPWKMWSSIGGARRGFRGLVPHLIVITIIIKGEVHYYGFATIIWKRTAIDVEVGETQHLWHHSLQETSHTLQSCIWIAPKTLKHCTKLNCPIGSLNCFYCLYCVYCFHWPQCLQGDPKMSHCIL